MNTKDFRHAGVAGGRRSAGGSSLVRLSCVNKPTTVCWIP